jgi:hypothetical protein
VSSRKALAHFQHDIPCVCFSDHGAKRLRVHETLHAIPVQPLLSLSAEFRRKPLIEGLNGR